MGQFLQLLSVFTAWSAGVFFIVKYIGKKFVDRSFERETIKFKSQLDKDLKLFDASLNETAIKYQIQFSNTHSKVASSITELYELIIALEYSIGEYMRLGGKSENEKKMLDDLNKLKRRYYETDLYFDNEINKKFLEIINAFVGVWADYATHVSYGDYRELEPDLKKEKTEIKKAAVECVTKHIPQLKTELKNEYQSILGITKPQSNEHTN